MRIWLFSGILLAILATPAIAGEVLPVHGLWVWDGPAILEVPRGPERLRDFCRAERINEVYVSIAGHGEIGDLAALAGARVLN